jgi:hypothetical protein
VHQIASKSHSRRGSSPVIKLTPDFSNRFNGLEWTEWLGPKKTVKTVPGVGVRFDTGLEPGVNGTTRQTDPLPLDERSSRHQ